MLVNHVANLVEARELTPNMGVNHCIWFAESILILICDIVDEGGTCLVWRRNGGYNYHPITSDGPTNVRDVAWHHFETGSMLRWSAQLPKLIMIEARDGVTSPA